MHSKTHFKFPFKSSKISIVSVKNIFLLNTTLPTEHYQIYFTIFEATKLEIQILQNSTKSRINELSYTLTAADRWDPQVRRPHTSVIQKQSSGAARWLRGQGSMAASSPTVTSSPRDLRDLAHRLSYSVGPLVGATHGGGAHGGAVRRDNGGCYGGCAEVKEEAENENGSTRMERARAGLVVVRSGPSWPRWAGNRRRAARYWLHAATKLWHRSATEAS